MSRREALLEATKELLWQRGYAATSPRDILHKSRSGQGSLYHYFKGKQELATEALREVEEQVSARLETTCGPDSGSGMQRLERYLLAERDALRGCRLGRLAQDPELPASLRRILADGFARVEAVLERSLRDAQLDGSLPACLSTDLLADSVVALVQGGYVLARAHQDPARMTRAVQGFCELLALLGSGTSKNPRARGKRSSIAPPAKSRKVRHAKTKPSLRNPT